MEAPPSGEPASGDRGRSISRRLLLAVLALGALALATTVLRDDTPRLTRESYASARARWERQAITDYTLDVLKELDDPDLAVQVALDTLREDGRGDGGLILADWRGRLAFGHSTPFMPVGWCTTATPGPHLAF